MATDANNSGEAEKVTFTPEQQTKIDELIKDAQGRAGKEFREKATAAESQLTVLKTELSQAQDKLAKATTSNKDGAQSDVEQLKAQIEEIKKAGLSTAQENERFKKIVQDSQRDVDNARNETTKVRRDVVIQKAANEANFVNVEVVAKLTADNIRWNSDKSKFEVVGDDGQPRVNSAYEPMTIGEFYTEYAAKNPYLVRSDVRSGNGSREGRTDVTRDGKLELKQVFGKGSDSKLANDLAIKNPAEYARLRVLAKEAGLLS